MLKPKSNNLANEYANQKKAEGNDRKKVNVDVVIDEKQVEREIDRALRRAIDRLNK